MSSFVRKMQPKGAKLIIGTGSNSTEKTVLATKRAAELGADAALVVVPYYNKPPQRGLLAHFTEVADNSEIPIILYNVPSRTITGLEIDTIVKQPGIWILLKK
jgi:4-hydroxy-tetrahydrodipicolinate synthase